MPPALVRGGWHAAASEVPITDFDGRSCGVLQAEATIRGSLDFPATSQFEHCSFLNSRRDSLAV